MHPPPDAIIVSGDIIQGARLGEAGWVDAAKAQYDVAEGFLGELADRLLRRRSPPRGPRSGQP